VLKATPRSFALRVLDQSMIGAGIQQGDIVVGEFRPEALAGAIVVALVDGEPVLKRLVLRGGRPLLVSENPNCRDRLPFFNDTATTEIYTVVHRVESKRGHSTFSSWEVLQDTA
jgi:SOS-response transcriptional repressor LexA